jgi:6-pyruvoyltetrahydropterin/6-carboxytetrahydropterin synthase
MITVTRRLEFDAGHRIPDHQGQCRNMHGHRYVLEVTLQGKVIEQVGAADNGMVIDFSLIKILAQTHLVQKWDHAFLVYKDDKLIRPFLESLTDHKTVLLDRTPTVENLARIAFDTLLPHYRHQYGAALQLTKIRLYETPNCWADYDG